MTSTERVSDSDGEIDFIVLWRVVWGRKYLIMLSVAICALIAVALALHAKPIFRAEVTVTEVSANGANGASSLANQFGGLANLVGVNLGGGGTSHEAQALLKSRRLVEEFIKRQGILSELFPDAKQLPSLWRGVERFQGGVLAIREDKRAGTTTVSINWTNPTVAASWANKFVALADELVRSRAMDDSKRSIAYLKEQIAHTSMVEVQHVMYNLIESETKTLMLANARTEYAFAVVDPAVAPETRISPQRKVMVIFGCIIGLVVGIILAFVHKIFIRHRRSAQQDL